MEKRDTRNRVGPQAEGLCEGICQHLLCRHIDGLDLAILDESPESRDIERKCAHFEDDETGLEARANAPWFVDPQLSKLLHP